MLNVFKGSPADKSGMLPGDYCSARDGQAISNADDLTQVVGCLVAGKTYHFDSSATASGRSSR